MKRFILGITVVALMASCAHKGSYSYTEGEKSMKTTVRLSDKDRAGEMQEIPGGPFRAPEISGGPLRYLPNATVFRMSGDFADNVAVTLSSSGELTYFPAPTDITADSKPISLGDGWWLNCQGIGPNSVFTKYTFAQYSELPETPSLEQLKNSIIPGAKVTDMKELPIKLSEAQRNPELAKSYLNN